MEGFSKKKRMLYIALLFAGVFLILQMQPVFADHDLEAILRNWFDKKQVQAIEKIDAAINREKEVQIERIQAAIKEEMEQAEAELVRFTDAEIEKRIVRLQQYADELIANYKYDDAEKKAHIENELDAILERARTEMEQVQAELSELNDEK